MRSVQLALSVRINKKAISVTATATTVSAPRSGERHAFLTAIRAKLHTLQVLPSDILGLPLVLFWVSVSEPPRGMPSRVAKTGSRVAKMGSTRSLDDRVERGTLRA